MIQDHDRDEAGPSGSGGAPARITPRASARPQYMTVGSGSTSASAAALMATLDNDSGYGSMINGQGSMESSRTSMGGYDRDVPAAFGATPSRDGSGRDDSQASHVHQMRYNHNRVQLNRAIGQTIDTLQGLQSMNEMWPAHYPTHYRAAQTTPDQTQTPNRSDVRPGMQHTQSTLGDASSPASRPGLRRAFTTAPSEAAGLPSPTSPQTDKPLQGLITAEAAKQFSVLKLDLKLEGLSQAEIAHSMDKKTIASLLDGRINQSVRHLNSLRERIEDTSSKVLVTGDLNAGKSTFCNALLRRKVLPEDQQPCTAIFCEVIDARENSGVEEVHAIHRDMHYDRNNERTYDVFRLVELEKVVLEDTKYMQCKVYVKDTRSIDQSLLNNGVVDIALIDAPGLNADSVKTTAVFARQEEIDVVVFVVSAPNHFTQSAKEFIWNAAQEKAYLFIVVNGYDNIRDKERCQRSILDQVARLSPRTFKESAELVHFVSSNAVPAAPIMPGGGPGPGGHSTGGSSSGGSGFGDPGHDPHDDDDPETLGKHGEPGSPPDKGKGKDKEKIEDFEHLESSLRRFILDKRARSKLAPARTYLMNVLSDLFDLATVNRDVAKTELERVTQELSGLEPQYKESQQAKTDAESKVDAENQQSCEQVRTLTQTVLDGAIAHVASQDLGVEYPGLLSAWQYAEDIKDAILDHIADAVENCEQAARDLATTRVGEIQKQAKDHLDDDYTEIRFQSDLMFSRRKHNLVRQTDVQVEFSDFIDLGSLWERQEKVAGTGMAMTVVGVLGTRMIGGVGWLDGVLGAVRIMGVNNIRHLVIPGAIATIALTTAYVLSTIPTSLPQRLSKRIASSLDAMDYTRRNSDRIAREVAVVLRMPSDNLRVGLQHSVEKLRRKRDETMKIKRESETACKYFTNLVRDSSEGRRKVQDIDLEASVVPVPSP